MELTIKREKWGNKFIPLVLLFLSVILLIPSAVIFASALTQPLIGMNGVNNSGLTVGMNGVTSSDRLIDFGDSGNLNPNSPAFHLANLLPLIILVVAIFLLLNMLFAEEVQLKNIIFAAVLILIALAFLVSIQSNVTDLLGG